MKQITLSSSEYNVAPLELPPELDAIRDRIKGRNQNYRIETGRDLIKAKALLPHGGFGPWLKDNFNWSVSTAQSFMNAARLADEAPAVEKLAPSAVMALSAPNTPNTVKAEVIADIGEGKLATAKEIKAKIAEAKPVKPQAKANASDATAVTALPVKNAFDAAARSAELDLVGRLKAAGLQASCAAFKAAFPGFEMVDYDDLEKRCEAEAA